MKKSLEIAVIVITTMFMIGAWAYMYVNNIRSQNANYWWQAGMALLALLFGVFGLLVSKYWSWLKSGVGRAVFFLSLGLIVWGIGQSLWTYYLFKYPNQQSPPTHVLDIIDLSSIPIWLYGIVMLSKATGARYGAKGSKAKWLVAGLSLVFMVMAAYVSVVVASGGMSYFHEPFWKAFFDISYPVGDAVILTISLAIFGLSWKYLGGRFKWPIVTILLSFVLLYMADFSFAYTDVRNTYFNGDWPDLLFIIMIGMLGLSLSLFDPSRFRAAGNKTKTAAVVVPDQMPIGQDQTADSLSQTNLPPAV